MLMLNCKWRAHANEVLPFSGTKDTMSLQPWPPAHLVPGPEVEQCAVYGSAAKRCLVQIAFIGTHTVASAALANSTSLSCI